jgi:hypothetical protein
MTLQEFLDFLDGNGIVVTDEDLIKDAIKWFDATLDSVISLDGEGL